MRFCKDCKHVDMSSSVSEFWRCRHADIGAFNPVTGELTTYCKTERMDLSINKCGKDGKLFEPFKMVTVEVLA